MSRLLTPAIVIGLLTGVAAAQEQETGLKVYQRVAPSVAALRSVEGSGTGFVIEADGLVLTNAHVVTSPLPYQMRVDVKRNGEVKPMIFKRVEVVGIHPKLDMALVKVDVSKTGGELVPVTISRERLSPGQRVYAIGNPGRGDGGILEKTITDGILSGSRVLDGIPYLQHAAAINPGNSGGPLCNSEGEVIGVNTLKSFNEGVGYALPLNEFRKDVFVAPEDREPDAEAVKEMLEAAKRLEQEISELKSRGAGDHPTVDMRRSYLGRLYGEILSRDPGNKALYARIGSLLLHFERYRMAAAYLVRGIELDPWSNRQAYVDLGYSLAHMKNQKMASIAHVEAIAKFPDGADQIATDLAKHYQRAKNYADAAYFAKMAIEMGAIPRLWDELNKIHDDAIAKLDADTGKAVRQRCAAVAQDFSKMKAAARQAKAANQSFLNKEFEKFITEYDALDQGEEKLVENLWGDDNDAEVATDNATGVASSTGADDTAATPTPAPQDPAEVIRKGIKAAETLARSRQKDKAVKALEDLIARHPDHEAIADAKRLLKTWTEPEPDPIARLIDRKLGLAKIFQQSGQKDKAVQTLEEIISQHPDHPDIKKAKDLLKLYRQ